MLINHLLKKKKKKKATPDIRGDKHVTNGFTGKVAIWGAGGGGGGGSYLSKYFLMNGVNHL